MPQVCSVAPELPLPTIWPVERERRERRERSEGKRRGRGER